MWETLREWTIDNPFFRLEWKRWVRRGGPWSVLCELPGLLLITLLGFHWIYSVAAPTGSSLPDSPMASAALGPLAFVHGFYWLVAHVPRFELPIEGVEHRFGFLRLLPESPRRVLQRIGVARVLLRSLILIVPLPVYLTLLWCGPFPWIDLGVLYLVLMVTRPRPPTPAEVTLALKAAEGWAPAEATRLVVRRHTRTNRGTTAGAERSLFGWIVLLGLSAVGLGLLGFVVRTPPPTVRAIAGGLVWLFGEIQVSRFVVGVVRVLGAPRPFYQEWLSPLWVGLGFWALQEFARVRAAGEIWARGPLPPLWLVLHRAVLGAVPVGGASGAHLRDLSPPQSRLLRVSPWAAMLLGLFVILGYCWRPWLGTGQLGIWVGQPTPGGSVATVVVLLASSLFLVLFEFYRCSSDPKGQPFLRTLWRVAAAMAGALGGVLLFGFAVGRAGGILPERQILAVVGGLVLSGSALLVFGFGWRQFRSRFLLGAAGPVMVSVRGVLCGTCWIASYLLPVLALSGWWDDPGVDRAAAVSPVYLLFLPFAPIWTGEALPPQECIAPPLIAGLVLAGIGELGRRPDRTSELGASDPLLNAFRKISQGWDNPCFELALRRRFLVQEYLTARIAQAAIGFLILSSAVWGVALCQWMVLMSGSLSDALTASTGLPGYSGGAALALIGAAAAMVISLLFVSSMLGTAVGDGMGLQRRQWAEDVRLSPLDSGEILRGMFWGRVVTSLPVLLAGPLAALCWVLVALTAGASPFWLVVWASSSATFVGMAGLEFLGEFRAWARKPRLSFLVTLGVGTGGLLHFASVAWLPLVVEWPGLWQLAPVGIPLVSLLAAGVTFAQVPAALRRAERWIQEFREEDAPLSLN